MNTEYIISFLSGQGLLPSAYSDTRDGMNSCAHLDNEELLPVGGNVEEDALEASRQRHSAHQEGNEYDIRKQG